MALQLNLFEEMNLLPTEIAEYSHSQNYEKRIKQLLDRMRGDRLHRFTKRTATVILVAAILFALVIAGFAATVGKEFIVRTFSDHFEYSVTDGENSKALTDLQINYIPEGFIMDNNVDDMKTVKNKLFLHGDEYFNVEKKSINDTIGFDTDNSEDYVIINNITYLYYGDAAYNLNGYIWNNGDYIYYIEGNISKDELLKIAQSVE